MIDRLEDLTGPEHGWVTLPRSLAWSGSPGYDLDDEGDAAALYQAVLNEASSPAELARSLNGDLLRRLWPTLWLAPRLRRLWESRSPVLCIPAGRPG